ncbi:MAG: hypothetical protein HY508_04950 [Acidobacteria bacterium]|nr:hypothetical protein [Acidobacteriota bacterium]
MRQRSLQNRRLCNQHRAHWSQAHRAALDAESPSNLHASASVWRSIVRRMSDGDGMLHIALTIANTPFDDPYLARELALILLRELRREPPLTFFWCGWISSAQTIRGKRRSNLILDRRIWPKTHGDGLPRLLRAN